MAAFTRRKDFDADWRQPVNQFSALFVGHGAAQDDALWAHFAA
jgi:hypothetical protein